MSTVNTTRLRIVRPRPKILGGNICKFQFVFNYVDTQNRVYIMYRYIGLHFKLTTFIAQTTFSNHIAIKKSIFKRIFCQTCLMPTCLMQNCRTVDFISQKNVFNWFEKYRKYMDRRNIYMSRMKNNKRNNVCICRYLDE